MGQANDPLSLNLYTYCYNNPVLFIDSSGHLTSLADIGNFMKNVLKTGLDIGDKTSNAILKTATFGKIGTADVGAFE